MSECVKELTYQTVFDIEHVISRTLTYHVRTCYMHIQNWFLNENFTILSSFSLSLLLILNALLAHFSKTPENECVLLNYLTTKKISYIVVKANEHRIFDTCCGSKSVNNWFLAILLKIGLSIIVHYIYHKYVKAHILPALPPPPPTLPCLICILRIYLCMHVWVEVWSFLIWFCFKGS